MKKYFIKTFIVCAMLGSSNAVCAQSDWGNRIKNALTSLRDTTEKKYTEKDGKDFLSSLTGYFSDKNVATEDKIIGTWEYKEPAIVLSSENTLKNIGGKIASNTAEKRLKEKLETYGFNEGSITMTFDKDGKFTQVIKDKTLKGTYTVEDKNIILKYNGRVSQIIGTTQLDGNDLLIVMDASKLLKYVNLLGSISQNATMKTASSLISSMDGLECGLRLVKK